jgi:hypothetical protein
LFLPGNDSEAVLLVTRQSRSLNVCSFSYLLLPGFIADKERFVACISSNISLEIFAYLYSIGECFVDKHWLYYANDANKNDNTCMSVSPYVTVGSSLLFILFILNAFSLVFGHLTL